MTTLSDAMLLDLRPVLHCQAALVRGLEASVARLEEQFAAAASQRAEIAELQHLMNELEANVGVLIADDLASFDVTHIRDMYTQRHMEVEQTHIRLGSHSWPSFVRSCQASLLAQGHNPYASYEMLLKPGDYAQLENESFDAQLRWDRWDYLIVGLSGVLAALTDILLVKTPVTSPLTIWLKQYNINTGDDWFARWARELEKSCRVPYDAMQTADGTRIPGMHGRSHRFQSLGHDPILGFVFGVLDILRGTISGFSYEHLRGQHSWTQAPVSQAESITLIEAVLRQIGHLLSDVATPAGLPAPFMTLLQRINVGSFGEKQRTVAQIARWMYLEGYDLRHFLVSGLTPGVIELLLRGYLTSVRVKQSSEAAKPSVAATASSADGSRRSDRKPD